MNKRKVLFLSVLTACMTAVSCEKTMRSRKSKIAVNPADIQPFMALDHIPNLEEAKEVLTDFIAEGLAQGNSENQKKAKVESRMLMAYVMKIVESSRSELEPITTSDFSLKEKLNKVFEIITPKLEAIATDFASSPEDLISIKSANDFDQVEVGEAQEDAYSITVKKVSSVKDALLAQLKWAIARQAAMWANENPEEDSPSSEYDVYMENLEKEMNDLTLDTKTVY